MKAPAPLTIIGGHYGSGKTELAVNLALALAAAGERVTLADLDIVNPYFRSVERQQELEAAGIRVLSGMYSGTADLPALPAELQGLFGSQHQGVGVIDLGGDPVGARVLSRYRPDLQESRLVFWFCQNAFRPETATLEKALQQLRQIESFSRQNITAIVNTSHLLDETTVKTVLQGDLLARELASASGLPYVLTVALQSLVPELEKQLSVPVLGIHRRMLKPWEEMKTDDD